VVEDAHADRCGGRGGQKRHRQADIRARQEKRED